MTKTIISFMLLLNIASNTHAQTWNEVTKAVSSDRDTNDQLGFAVGISGKYAIVGARFEAQNTVGLDTLKHAGSAYIYERDSSGNWNQAQKIVASDRASYNYFGISVNIDASYAIAGSPYNHTDTSGGNYVFEAGAVYIFERDSSGSWGEVQKIAASDRTAVDNFGFSLSISGNHIIVGVPQEDEDALGANTMDGAGSAYIFERDTLGNWSEVQKIVASDRDTGDSFGYSSISGNYAIIGAGNEDEDISGGNTLLNAGSAYIFERDTFGVWNEGQKIVASDRAVGDIFGVVSISGNYAVVGAYSEDEDASGGNTLLGAGSAYIFERDTFGVWSEVQKIVASDRAEGDYFGARLSISGNHIIAGVTSDLGSAYIFERDTLGNWNEVQKIVAPNQVTYSFFGYAVSISNNSAIVGAHSEREDASGGNTIPNAGAAYIFEATSSVYIQETLNDANVLLYPNPSNSQITIEINSRLQGPAELTIINLLGEEVYNGPLPNSHNTYQQDLDVSSYSKGIYFLTLNTAEGVISQKIVVQ